MNQAAQTGLERLMQAGSGLLHLCVKCLRFSLLSLLLVAEPIVTATLSAFALGGIGAIVLFRFIAHSPSFPLGTMAAFTLCAALLLISYRVFIELLLGNGLKRGNR